MKPAHNTLPLLALVLSLLAAGPVEATSPATPVWIAPVDQNDEHGHAIVVKDGFVYACGITEHAGSEQLMTVKYDAAGTAREWIRFLPISVSGNDAAVCDLVVLGKNTYVMTRDAGNLILVKYDQNGNEKWVKDDFGYVDGNWVALSARSGRIFLGGNALGSNGYQLTVARYKTDGARLWKKTLASSEESYFLGGLAADSDGNVCAVGARAGEFLTVKFSPSGAKLWERTYTGLAGGNSAAYGVAAPVAAGPVYVVGISATDGGGKEYATLKYTHGGQRQWARRFSPGSGITAYYKPFIAATPGKVYACTTIRFGSGNSQVRTFAYDTGSGSGVYGKESWVKTWQQNGGRVEAASIVVDGQGRAHVAASVYTPSWEWEMATQMYTAGGGYFAARRFGPGEVDHRASDIAVDGSGHQYVVGSRKGNGGWDMLTIKLLSQTSYLLAQAFDPKMILTEFRYYQPGDADGDGAVELNDGLTVLNFLFQKKRGSGMRCLDAADADRSGVIELNDAIRILSFKFLGGASPIGYVHNSCSSAIARLGCDGYDACPAAESSEQATAALRSPPVLEPAELPTAKPAAKNEAQEVDLQRVGPVDNGVQKVIPGRVLGR